MTTDTPNQASSLEETGKHEIDTLILDTGPIIKNVCSPQSLLAKAGTLITLPSVVSEIRDAATRSRFETLWAPFLQYRSPRPESIKYISQFAKKTGDYGVLGATDLQVLALTYEVECEKIGGIEEFEKRLKKKEGEKNTSKKGSSKKNKRRGGKGKTTGDGQTEGQTEGQNEDGAGEAQNDDEEGWTTIPTSRKNKKPPPKATQKKATKVAAVAEPQEPQLATTEAVPSPQDEAVPELPAVTGSLEALSLTSQPQPEVVEEIEPEITSESEDDWITPDNLAVHLISDGTVSKPATKATQTMAACCTTDFAMQNVLLQLHIHLFSPTTMSRITAVKSHVLRCHACFKVCREMSRQFCPSCGQPALAKVTCSTDSRGVFRIHLKKNWQWNNRGNVFSLSKPQHGTASMKGVRENIVLSEDQKEYEKALKDSKRFKERDLMDIDYLPGLLTGERLGHGGNPKVGAGKNVNASKRRGK
ncbi:Nin1 binding protein [Arthrobotrys musiformis]|uniref:20S-pre-rRNA D-site endonuclease NOB1 n=1 Tax=Arthrobotrys musiformis TaxID=47236 RepID=A0AAV9WKK4_9PEZI